MRFEDSTDSKRERRRRAGQSVGAGTVAKCATIEEAVPEISETDQDLLSIYGSSVSHGTQLISRQQAEEALHKVETARKRAEELLRQTTLELERANGDLEQFAQAASHDLRSPLCTMISFAQLLKQRYQGRLDAEADEFIAFIVDGADRMLAMIEGLRAFSRVQGNGKEMQPVDCQTALDRAVTKLGVALREANAEVTHDPLPTVLADESQMEQLFQNLVDNAVKFRGQHAPRVHVSAARNGKEWIFSVADNGTGINPRHKDRIFGLFQRLHPRTTYPGTGMGLPMCKKIVERHGGRIWVESAEGRGATFYFTMPLAERVLFP